MANDRATFTRETARRTIGKIGGEVPLRQLPDRLMARFSGRCWRGDCGFPRSRPLHALLETATPMAAP
jgi:hypothetical protein